MGSDPGLRRALVSQWPILSKLDHQNIVRLGDYFREGRCLCLVMEYVPGRRLGDLLTERFLGLEEALQMAVQVLSGLAYAHTFSPMVVHGEINPHNILITDDGHPTIIGFGEACAHAMHLHTYIDTTRDVLDMYATPEGIGRWPSGSRSTTNDVYSMGLVLYKMLTGVLPFPVSRENWFDWSRAHRELEPIPLSEFREGVPKWLQKLVSRALAKKTGRPVRLRRRNVGCVPFCTQSAKGDSLVRVGMKNETDMATDPTATAARH